jgi:hypothetical protein
MSQSGSSAGPAMPNKQRLGNTPNSQLQDLSTNEQSRIYQRANENLIIQTKYIEDNLSSIGTIRNKLDPNSLEKIDEKDRDSIPILTSQYCSSDTVKDDDGARECLDQYKEMKVARLREIRQGLISNDDAQASLKEDLVSAKTKTGGLSKRAPVYKADIKQRVFPEIPKYIDMEKDFAARPKEQPNIRRDAQEAMELAKQVLKKPDPADFPKFSEELIDPNNPSGGTFHTIARGKDGKPEVDTEAFQAALKLYNEKILKLRGKASEQTLKNTIAERILNAQKVQRETLSRDHTLNAAVGASSIVPGKEMACESLPLGPRRDYCEARIFVVQYFNGEAESQKKELKDSKDKKIGSNGARIPASGPAKNPGTEAYELKVSKPATDGKNEVDSSLYMEPSYIDSVIENQYKD